MATVAEPILDSGPQPDRLSGTPRAHALDRWIYVITAASFIAIVLAGFIPNSLAQIEAIRAGQRAPFPLVAHLHALAMGSFLVLLLTQTLLVAVGREGFHRRLGMTAMLLVPAIVVVGFLLVPTNYLGVWHAALAASGAARAQLDQLLAILDNIMLLQLRIGILFPICMVIALRARGRDDGLHKRMMILGTALALPAGIDRIPWLPTTMPVTPVATDLYTLLAIAPMLAWDVLRNRAVHRAYWIWLGLFLIAAILVHSLWDTAWWHAAARRLMGV